MLFRSDGGQDQGPDSPLHTITGTARHALVTVTLRGQQWVLADIGLRMLASHELAAAQGFPADYVLHGTQAEQIKLIGNSVPPDVQTALIRSLFASQQALVA